MLKLIPVGERCLVEEIEVEDPVIKSAREAGIVAVQLEKDYRRPSHGKVVAIGSGPLINETLKVGDTVFFNQYAGKYTIVEGKKYRNLEIGDITDVLREDEPTVAFDQETNSQAGS